MSDTKGPSKQRLLYHNGYRWAALVVVFVLVFTAFAVSPAGAATRSDSDGGSLPNLPNQPNVIRSYTAPALAQTNGQAQPPLPNLGGTCISGYLIDSYHQSLGAGWEVTLTPEEGASQTTTTDVNGRFQFTDLPGGVYTVSLTLMEGFRPFTPIEFTVTLSGEGDGCADVRFKLEALPCIEVIKQDAHQVNGEPIGIPGWGFVATQNSTSLQAVTDGQGRAFFRNLTPGVWVVTEEEKLGWRPADGFTNSLQFDLVAPRDPGVCVQALFVNQQIQDACIIVEKRDIVGDPVEGWLMSLTRDDGTQAPAQGTTDDNGRIVFDGLALGTWTVQEEIREWWRPVGETTASVTLERPGYCEVVTFVNEPLGCVDGYKINQFDQGLLGWEIAARNLDTGETFTTTTDANGYFFFNTLPLGTWVMSETIQEGWEAVTPAEFQVQVTEPFVCETVRFKNRTDFACVDVFKRDEIDGVGLPGWNITVQPAYGGLPVNGVTDGSGWVRFNGLVPGVYTISEQVVPGWTPTTPESVTMELLATGSCYVVDFQNIQTHMLPPDDPDDGARKPGKPEKSCPLYYTVKRGDTLWAISRRYDVPVSAIVRVNHIKNPSLIYAGTRLCIPLGDP